MVAARRASLSSDNSYYLLNTAMLSSYEIFQLSHSFEKCVEYFIYHSEMEKYSRLIHILLYLIYGHIQGQFDHRPHFEHSITMNAIWLAFQV